MRGSQPPRQCVCTGHGCLRTIVISLRRCFFWYRQRPEYKMRTVQIIATNYRGSTIVSAAAERILACWTTEAWRRADGIIQRITTRNAARHGTPPIYRLLILPASFATSSSLLSSTTAAAAAVIQAILHCHRPRPGGVTNNNNNNNNSRTYIAPYGRNFRSAGGRSDQCSVKACSVSE